MKLYKYINIFLFYSIIGNIFERVCMYFSHKDYISGFMGTIFTPIYGIAILVILFIHNKIKIKNKYLKIIIEFFIYVIVLTFLEFLGGILVENIFNKVFWNYETSKYNIGKYVSLDISLIWGLLSLLVLYFFHPLVMKFLKHIPKFTTIVGCIIFIINLFLVLFSKIT